jgi:epoxide hydrolase-like predicted phosphatase
MQITSQQIKALIFDFGGVLIRTESWEPRQRLASRLGVSTEELYTVIFDSEATRLAELGRISSHERWQHIADALGLTSAEECLAVVREFFSGDVLDSVLVNHIRQWHARFKTALLSNFSRRLPEFVQNELGLGDCFDVIIASALVGMRKPDPAIYHLALNELQLAPHEAVFIDDMRANVEGAASIGMHAILFTTRDALLAELNAALGERPRQQGVNK